MVGDRWRDVEAGIAAGCRTFFIDYGYDEKQPTDFDFRVQSLLEASKIILGDNYSGGKLKVKIFADGADKSGMLEMYDKKHIKGLTTNPTLMKRQALEIMPTSVDILTTIR